MTTTAERIRKLRKKLRFTQKQLADLINVSPQVVSNWERQYTTPDANDIRALADALETSVDYLLGRTDKAYMVDVDSVVDTIQSIGDDYNPKSKAHEHRIRNILRDFRDGHLTMVPVLGYIRAGQPIDRIESVEDYELAETDLVNGHDAFILRVKGESMSGDNIHDGDRVLVICTPDFSPSDICAVAIDGDYATLKRVRCENGVCALVASNPGYKEPMIYPASEVHVIGVVVEVRHRLKR